jgi:membrane carboxypeptidase/penicillin-binding protein
MNGRYGFAAASQYYFGIPVTQLTADDADKTALLAGITKSPGEYAPTLADNPKPLRRRNQILALMVKNHFLSAQAAGRCQQAPIRLAAHLNAPIEAPAAVENVLDELKSLDVTLASDVGINQLLDDRLQRFANAALENGLNLYEKRHPKHTGLIQGSVVAFVDASPTYLGRLPCCPIHENESGLSLIQEGLRGVVRIPSGTAHALDARTFPIPVMGKTGTTNNYRDALFLGSTYGPNGITVAVRIGFDDNRSLGETGGRAALPIFREVMLNTYQAKLVGPVPSFPANMENNIADYLNGNSAPKEVARLFNSPHAGDAEEDRVRRCRAAATLSPTNACELPLVPLSVVYQHRDERGKIVFTNE